MRGIVSPTSKTAEPFLELRWECFVAQCFRLMCGIGSPTSKTIFRFYQSEPHPPSAEISHVHLPLFDSVRIRSPFPASRGRLDRFAIEKKSSIVRRQKQWREYIEIASPRANGAPTFPASRGKEISLRSITFGGPIRLPNWVCTAVPKNGSAVFDVGVSS